MAIIGAIDAGIGLAGSIFGHPKDAERRQKADELYSRALSGDAAAYRQLDCLSGSQTYAVEFNATAPPGCGFATESTRAYAKGLLAKLKAKQVIAETAADVSTGAAAVGLDQNQAAFVDKAKANIAGNIFPTGIPGTIAGIPTWLIAVGAGASIYFLVKR